MVRVYIILVAYVPWLISPQANEYPNSCHAKADGFYTNFESNCEKYFYCESGKIAYNGTCTRDYAYSSQKQKCVPKTEVICIDIQCRNINKYFSTPGTGCTMYYICHAGRRHDYLCPTGLTFNYDLQSCVKNGLCADPICTGRINGKYTDISQMCQRSFLCVGGSLTSVENCARNQIFSNTLKRCTSDVQTNDTCTAMNYPKQDNPKCKNLSDGPYIEPNTDCQDYFICKNKISLGILTCPAGSLFNGKQCVSGQYYSCKDPGCSKLPDGIHADLVSDCQEFFYCLDRKLVWKDSCPPNMSYDGVRCVNSAYYTCPKEPLSETNICLHREDGYHKDFATCNEYFYCVDNELVFRGVCPDQHVWNGNTCVQKGWFFCEGPTEWIGCLIKKGFFQDNSPLSQCTEYYYCANGKRTSYSCPPSESFDGEKCIPKHLYNCPVAQSNIQCRHFTSSYHTNSDSQRCIPGAQHKCTASLPPLDICANKLNGLHTLPKTACRQYARCQNGKTIQKYSCGHDQVFDSISACVPKNCTTSLEPRCKQDGFFIDLDSRCKSYYFCIDGTKTTLTCPAEKLFNGQICIAEHLFTCPEQCTRFKDCDNSIL